MFVCVHSLQRSSSHISAVINHTPIHLASRPSSGLSWCFMASPATIQGWQPHSARGWRGNGRGSGERDVVSEEVEWKGGGGEKWVSVEKESGDERQTVKQVQKKKGGERVTEKVRQPPDVLTLRTQAAVQGRQCGKLLLFIYALILPSAGQTPVNILWPAVHRDRWQTKGNGNIKWFSGARLRLSTYPASTAGTQHHSSTLFPSLGFSVTVVVVSTILNLSESPIGFQLGCAPVTLKSIAYESYHIHIHIHQTAQWSFVPRGWESCCPGGRHTHRDNNVLLLRTTSHWFVATNHSSKTHPKA